MPDGPCKAPSHVKLKIRTTNFLGASNQSSRFMNL